MIDKPVITTYPRERLISMMYDAKFPKKDNEAIYLGTMVFNYRQITDILPDILNPKQDEKDLANRGLLAVGFFREKLEHRENYHGGPSIKYFMEMTRRRLIRIGQKDVAENTENWANYLHDSFQIKRESKERDIIPVHTYEKSKFHKKFPNNQVWKGLGPLKNTPLGEDIRKNIELN